MALRRRRKTSGAMVLPFAEKAALKMEVMGTYHI